MNLQEAIVTCMKKYFVFEGRATRSEYWYFTLFALLAGSLLSVVDMQLSPDGEASTLGTIFWAAIVFPSLAVSTRRLHDIGRSGWWQLLWLTIFGGILMVIWQCFPSDPALNKYDVANAAPART